VEAAQDRNNVRQFANSVGIGESEAIELALELRADHLLIDERKGRREKSFVSPDGGQVGEWRFSNASRSDFRMTLHFNRRRLSAY